MSEEGRRQLGEFLRLRRGRIEPADVGLPAGLRRRTPGLRREEVAVLSGLSPTWYTYLEQGRGINPSSQVLDSLARVLKLSDDERRYLHSLVTVSGPVAKAPEAATALIEQFVHLSDDSPFPVYAINLYSDLLAWNPAVADYYTDFDSLPADRRNMLRWMLEAPAARERLADWEEETRAVVARLRAVSAHHDGDPRLATMIDGLKRTSPQFAQWWGDHDVLGHGGQLRRFNHPGVGAETLRLLITHSPDFEPDIVVFHLPVG
jgi:transcriptional regulator with XRE-family HTH domain